MTNPKQDYSGKITSIGSRERKRSVNITAFLMLPNKCMGIPATKQMHEK